MSNGRLTSWLRRIWRRFARHDNHYSPEATGRDAKAMPRAFVAAAAVPELDALVSCA